MPRNRNGRQNRNTTRVVVQSTSGNQQAPSAPRQRRTGRSTVNVNVHARPQQPSQRQQPNTRVRVRLNGRGRRRQQGPGQHQIHQEITTTLGTVGSNTSNDVETELTTLINPALMKEQTGSNNYGPLNILASQYALWKVDFIEIKLKPLVGNNAAAGTITRISYNPGTGAGQTSWSSLGARKHRDVRLGQEGTFRLTSTDVKGPKGGWFYTNTTNDANMACGGTINIHSLGKTTSPYTNTDYQGPLYLCEVRSRWVFKDYLQQPGLINMMKGEETHAASIGSDANGKIYMKVETGSRLAAAANNPGASEIIWNITDTIIQAGTSAFPPPLNWLFRGGWWFIKRLVNAPVNDGGTYFEVFPSFTDAQNDRPAYSTTASVAAVPISSVTYQQVTPANTGLAADQLMVARSVPPQPRGYRVLGLTAQYDSSSSADWLAAVPMWYMKQSYTSSDRGILLNPGAQRVTTYDLFKAEVDGAIPTSGLPVYFRDETRVEVGYGVAWSHYSGNIQASGTNSADKPIRLTSLLFYAHTTRAYTFTQSNDGTFIEASATFNRNARGLVVGSNPVNSRRLDIRAGNWYVAQFLCIGTPHRTVELNGGTIYVPTDAWTTTEVHYSVPSQVGFATNGFPAAYGTALSFTPIDSIGAVAYNNSAEQLDPDDDDEDGDYEDADEENTLYFDEPPVEYIQVEPEVQDMYNILVARGATHRQAALAVNQIRPSKKYEDFVATYHDSLVDGCSPAQARAKALGQEP
nr:capsid precursor protein [Bovine astrovirus]